MSDSVNLKAKLEAHLSPDQVTLLREAASAARSLSRPLYLVGGVVRDLLMDQPIQDIDLVVEGDVTLLARTLAENLSGDVVAHSQFNTAKVDILGQSIDIVTARHETYRRPGALPTVKPGDIQDDLRRRDFTINAMAVRLSPEPSGKLLDPLDGRRDLSAKLVRVLHPGSFRDDATRILRALRYEQRLHFRLEQDTAVLLRRDLSMLDTIGGHRLRRELALTFHEREPRPILARLAHLGVLGSLHPPLARNRDMESMLARLHHGIPRLQLLHYLAWLAYPLRPAEAEGLIARLAMPKRWAAVVRDTVSTRHFATELTSSASPAAVYRRLSGLSLEAVQVAAALETNGAARESMTRYAEEWRKVRPLLTGQDIVKLGVAQGPQVGELLDLLLEARLKGGTTTRAEERALVRQRLEEP
ncbi:MAG: hypothetical protein O7D33_09205 [Chloroflexi bacterium]|nr:hypothetical protein [Chloroflexota bacterium]